MRFVCIHGHFYRPPRENPWLGLSSMTATGSRAGSWRSPRTVAVPASGTSPPTERATGITIAAARWHSPSPRESALSISRTVSSESLPIWRRSVDCESSALALPFEVDLRKLQDRYVHTFDRLRSGHARASSEPDGVAEPRVLVDDLAIRLEPAS